MLSLRARACFHSLEGRMVMQAAALSLLIVSASLAQPGRPQPPRYQAAARPQRFYGHGSIRKEELTYQKDAFKQWWGTEYVTKLADLPTEGKVPDARVPYSGHDYPDMAGGTLAAMSKYDRAFHSGRGLATGFEQRDIGEHRALGRDSGEEHEVRGPFGRVWRTSRGRGVPTWYGHCNGWTAAAIRHAEPQKSVVRNGVTFTPADIKGLLAELYMYADSEFLGGVDPAINPAVLHLTLANWLGRGAHPLGMETAVGEVVINFPLFNYKTVVNRQSSREAEARTWITYAVNTNREMDKSPEKYHRQMYFHYVLELNADGEIAGGRYFGDSMQLDMLWAPLKPAQGGEERNKRGNPHLKVKEVLAIWRESVSDDVRNQWLNIDPTEEDRIAPPAEALATNPPTAIQPAAGQPATSEAATETPATNATASTTTASAPSEAEASAEPATAAPVTATTESANTPAATTPATSPPASGQATSAEPTGTSTATGSSTPAEAPSPMGTP